MHNFIIIFHLKKRKSNLMERAPHKTAHTHAARQSNQARAEDHRQPYCIACATTSKPLAPCPSKCTSNVQREIGAPLDSIAATAALATLAPQPVATEVATLL